MTFSLYDAAVPVFANSLRDMRAWLDKPGLDEAMLMAAMLAPDMRPLPAQFQMASDSAKNAVARLTGATAPAMPDTEASFAELRDRCDKTIAYIESVGLDAFEGAAEREVVMRFPNGMGYRWPGAVYLTSFALPNFFFRVTTAYAILRKAGVQIGKSDFLGHLGMPTVMPAAD